MPIVSGQPTGNEKEEIGFYGKRFQISLGVGGNINAFPRLVNTYERNFRKSATYAQLRENSSKGLFNYSFYATVGYAIKERVTLSLDLNYLKGNALSLYSYSKYASTTYAFRFNYDSYRFMPRIEISSKNAESPVGLTHILGLGIELSLAVSGKYYTYYYPVNNNTNYIPGDQKINFSRKPHPSIALLYGVEYRIPIAKWAAVNLGGYFNLNFSPSVIFTSQEYEQFTQKTNRLMGNSRFQNLFSLRTGLIILL